MKLSGISGKGRGRLGSMVFSTNGGEQIVRQYQPNVKNPNTPSQVANRAKLKLMSQIAAAVSAELPIKRNGTRSARNQFISRNFAAANFANDAASVDLTALQFTTGNVSLPAVVARQEGGNISVSLATTASVSRVCYLCYSVTAQKSLIFASSAVSTTAEDTDGRFFPALIPFDADDAIIYAYGMRDLTAAAASAYADYSVTDGTSLATLLTSRTIADADYILTATSSVLLPFFRIVSVDFYDVNEEKETWVNGSSYRDVADPPIHFTFNLNRAVPSTIKVSTLYARGVQSAYEIGIDGEELFAKQGGTSFEWNPDFSPLETINDQDIIFFIEIYDEISEEYSLTPYFYIFYNTKGRGTYISQIKTLPSFEENVTIVNGSRGLLPSIDMNNGTARLEIEVITENLVGDTEIGQISVDVLTERGNFTLSRVSDNIVTPNKFIKVVGIAPDNPYDLETLVVGKAIGFRVGGIGLGNTAFMNLRP